MAIEFQKPDDDEDEGTGADERESEHGEPVQGDDGEGEGADETPDLDEDPEKEEIDAEPAKPSRAQSRIQALSVSAREASDRATRAEQRAQELEQRLTRLEQPAPKEKEPSAEEMALWTSDQVISYRLGQAEKRNQEQINQLRFQTLEQGDKTAWNAQCASDTRAKKMAADVETRLQQYRNNGMWFWSRQDVYEKMVGERIARQGTKAVETQRQQGQQRIARQRTPSGSPAGDQPARRGQLTPQQERDRRLKDSGFFSDT